MTLSTRPAGRRSAWRDECVASTGLEAPLSICGLTVRRIFFSLVGLLIVPEWHAEKSPRITRATCGNEGSVLSFAHGAIANGSTQRLPIRNRTGAKCPACLVIAASTPLVCSIQLAWPKTSLKCALQATPEPEDPVPAARLTLHPDPFLPVSCQYGLAALRSRES